MTMELETRRFYETAARQATDASIRQLLGDLAEDEREHSQAAEQMAAAWRNEDEAAAATGFSCFRWFSPAGRA